MNSIALGPDVARQIEEIRQDRTHGASWLSRQALSVMSLAAEKSEAKGVVSFLEELKVVANELIKTKPSMASITNHLSHLVYEVSQKSKAERDLDSLKKFTHATANRLIKDSEEAFLEVAKRGAEIIEKGDSIITCSYSSTICQAFRIAKLAGKEFRVVVTESKSSSGRAYGEVTAAELQSYGIRAEIIPDNIIKAYILGVNKTLVGADSLLADGSLINGTLTYELASAAKESHIPFYSLCEMAKFDVRSFLGQQPELEEGFDRTPHYLITGIMTEEGVIKPSQVISYMKKMTKYVGIFLHR